jgi:hypothetical protein
MGKPKPKAFTATLFCTPESGQPYQAIAAYF